MVIAKHPSELPRPARGICFAMGMFDGVHLGHQHVIRSAQLDAAAYGARTTVITFDPHPLAVVNPERAPLLLQTLDQRLRAIATLGNNFRISDVGFRMSDFNFIIYCSFNSRSDC